MKSFNSHSRYILLGDIGGTNCRLAIWDVVTDEFVDRVRYSTEDYVSPTEAIAAFLATNNARTHRASLALACPVTDDRPKLTNTGWEFDRAQLLSAFGWDSLIFVNDLVAQARAVRDLSYSGFKLVCGPMSKALPAPAVIVGPGTGLGVALLEGQGVTPSEAGHIGFAPRDAFELRLIELWQPTLGMVSNEHVLSGPGLVRLYRATALMAGRPFEPIDAPEIVRRGLANECQTSAEACERFTRILGAAAGDYALSFCAASVVLIGGIVTSLLPLFEQPGFAEAFQRQAPGRGPLKSAPVAISTAGDLGLHGARALMEDMGLITGSASKPWVN